MYIYIYIYSICTPMYSLYSTVFASTCMNGLDQRMISHNECVRSQNAVIGVLHHGDNRAGLDVVVQNVLGTSRKWQQFPIPSHQLPTRNASCPQGMLPAITTMRKLWASLSYSILQANGLLHDQLFFL